MLVCAAVYLPILIFSIYGGTCRATYSKTCDEGRPITDGIISTLLHPYLDAGPYAYWGVDEGPFSSLSSAQFVCSSSSSCIAVVGNKYTASKFFVHI